ncbi:AbrB/MazE/SpoVT family DNA-binding domain-containing protein [Bacillus sp. JJ1127]|uniref:AbrB/MazE/SpoVT family DNA-binding domain-containing protein n=1 Tax=Bacillus sp. JJ1127 TaxID=3122952 RepID=UPI002FFE795C
MKNTGIVRKVDELGRVVIPIEMRRTLGIFEGTSLEINVYGESIFIKKHEKACLVTGELSDENIELLDGQIALSPDGAKILLEAILQSEEKRGEVVNGSTI